MAVTLGGSAGITFPDATNLAAADVTGAFSPAITDTANVMSIQSDVKIIGASGVFANGILSTTSRKAISYVFSANAANASLNVSSLSGYTAGKSDITITVNSNVYLYATSTSSAGLTLTGGSTGDTITIVNNGYIMGMGGNGATYGNNPATSGGPALSLGFNTTINNTNAAAYIGGGGGGGGGNGPVFTNVGGGGGAGGGTGGNGINGSGGAGGAVGIYGSNAQYNTGYGGGSGGGGGKYDVSGPCCCAYFWYGGGGGGRIFPGVGGAGGTGSGGNGGNGGSGSAAGSAGGVDSGGGGGGWGASGGLGSAAYAGGAGGKAVALNGKTVTWVSGNTTRVYGAVA